MGEIKKQMDDAKQREYKDLYEAYYRHAYAAARQIINQHEECEDIVQESFLRCNSDFMAGCDQCRWF
ncbi:sigma factor [Eubacterium oxidoreducens]|uniref:Sigma-70 region 2 n=1 Tax=Eubacterium oxidoreducens TaxID=1732 RepID=A0A1G6A3T1_EUBOX|nr:sigma factor [Eubacterium oxidoreducens]SDB03045.1 Sigma-70 region 2 [Eubacterium oxidoreducens]